MNKGTSCSRIIAACKSSARDRYQRMAKVLSRVAGSEAVATIGFASDARRVSLMLKRGCAQPTVYTERRCTIIAARSEQVPKVISRLLIGSTSTFPHPLVSLTLFHTALHHSLVLSNTTCNFFVEMFSIFAQTASVSVSESQSQPTNEGGRNDAVYGYSSCTVA